MSIRNGSIPVAPYSPLTGFDPMADTYTPVFAHELRDFRSISRHSLLSGEKRYTVGKDKGSVHSRYGQVE